MNKAWLLNNSTAKSLYETVAHDLPIIDYHNHLSIKDIAQNRTFENITHLWITPDPYKHRAMRILGVPERYITGDTSDFEKFEAWYTILPRLIGNPLYDWSLMEFEWVLGLELANFQRTAAEVWTDANARLKDLSAHSILNKFNVEYCAPCTTLDDNLKLFEECDSRFAPSLRGDDLLLPSPALVKRLEELTNVRIDSFATWESAIDQRLQTFRGKGCCYTDHALDNGFYYVPNDGKNEDRFHRLLMDLPLDKSDQLALSSFLLVRLANLYAKHSLNMQLHIGAQRSTSTRLRQCVGMAGGYTTIGHSVDVTSLTSLLDAMEQTPYGLPKTLLFTLNPADNAIFSTLSGSYSKDGVEAIVSQGPAWWWCDHRQGMVTMLEHLSNYGILSSFVGMTTDSRSLLSFARHDYFRRVLCNWIGEQAETYWEIQDPKLLSNLVHNLCYGNAAKTIHSERNQTHEPKISR